MAPEETPLRCLAVAVSCNAAGEIDTLELESFMNGFAGLGQWLSTGEWLFVEPPQTALGQITAPVAVPVSVAVRAILADLTNEPPRVLSDHAMSPGEIRKWRWAAHQIDPRPQGQGVFPWEAHHA